MALINPSNLYSEGQVNLDSTPYIRMYQQQQAKKQAREDALYKYYSELPNKINSAGMRVQDIDGTQGGFNKKIGAIRSFWDANKKDILRGGKAAQVYQGLIQDANQYADQSKKTGQFQLKFGQDFFQGKHKPRQRDLEIIASIDKPIDDVSHYKDSDIKMPYTYNDFSIAAPDFDANRQIAFDKSILGKAEPQILQGEQPRYDANTYEVIYNKKYRPEDIYAAAQKAAGDLQGNLSAMNFYEDALGDEDQVRKASEALSKLTGTQVIAETPEQMAAGLKAAQFMNYSQEVRKKDKDAVMDRQEADRWARMRQTHEWQKARDSEQQGYRVALKYGLGNKWLDEKFKNWTENPTETLVRVSPDGKRETIKVLGTAEKLKKIFTAQDFEPDVIIQYENGDIAGTVYQRDANYNIVKQDGKSIIDERITPIRLTKEQAKIYYGQSITSGKDLTEELSPQEKQVLSETKSGSSKKGFTLNATQRRK